jgi:hypothetical protein
MISLLLAALVQAGDPAAAEVEAIRKDARNAEATFERLARQLAPLKYSGMDGTRCDEIVGRFCIRYDDADVPEPPAEPDRVVLARRLAIEALRRSFSVTPEQFETAGPLVRYLVEDDRASEASNAIIFAKNGQTAGIGAGQMNRRDSARIAALRAGEAAETAKLPASLAAGSACASDAFFPFPDGLLQAVEAGATSVIQPGGSIRDEDVIKAADEAGIAMAFTGMRHFRH